MKFDSVSNRGKEIFLQGVVTVPGAHPVSWSVGAGTSFPGSKAGGA